MLCSISKLGTVALIWRIVKNADNQDQCQTIVKICDVNAREATYRFAKWTELTSVHMSLSDDNGILSIRRWMHLSAE